MKITNQASISLPLAVWLLADDYDLVTGVDNYISVTKVMKPVRQIVLPHRIPAKDLVSDVSDQIPRRLGHAIHDSIERSWKSGSYVHSLRQLGYPAEVIGNIAVNPTWDEIDANPDIIPVYLEQRAMREFEGFTIGGKFDMVADGILTDVKSTSVWAWIMGTRDDDHRLQMSLYRWIDAGQDRQRITEDYCQVNYVFTDWQKNQQKSNPNYPQTRVATKTLPLMSLQEVEDYLRLKLALVNQNFHLPEKQVPHCTEAELWMSAPKYKYFKDPAKAQDPKARSTKNFEDLQDAHKFKAQNGGVGVIVTVPGEAKACGYCPAFDICTQKDLYL
jgi:hypothetical protein